MKHPRLAAGTESQEVKIRIPEMVVRRINITLVGDSPLICHRWSEKAMKQILDKQMKRAKTAKAAKNPEQDYRDSLYPYPGGGYGFPISAFKSAAVDACPQVDGLNKTHIRGAIHIDGDLAKISGTPRMREDMVRIGQGKPDIRYRGEFRKWSVSFTVRYNSDSASAEQIVNLFNTAGFAVGIGEWRPQKDGSFGMFHVATQKEL